MHLVARDARAACDLDAAHGAQCLVRCHGRVNVEQVEAGTRGVRPFDLLRIFDDPAEHLVSGADPEHPAAAAHVRLQVDVPTLRTHEFEIGDRRLAARKNDEICIERQRPL